MTRDTFEVIRNHMLDMMKDCAHDYLHIYRVLYQALAISKNYEVDKDVLIASCLLHDIGRTVEFQNSKLCHAIEGGVLAYDFMKKLGWQESQYLHIKECITTHRFRSDNLPKTMEKDNRQISFSLYSAQVDLCQNAIQFLCCQRLLDFFFPGNGNRK